MRFSSVRITRIDLRARRRFHVQQLLDRQAIAQPVRDRRHVVHAVHVRRELLVGAVLANLLNAAVQVSDHALRAQHLFAIELEDDAQHAVRGRVLRAHVENQFSGIQECGFRHRGLLAAFDSQVLPAPNGRPAE